MPKGVVGPGTDRPLGPRHSATIEVVPFEATSRVLQLPRIRAYVDETGDRGHGPSSSPIFGMSAVLVDEKAELEARGAIDVLRADFGTPATRPLSWKEDIKTNHDRRAHAAEVLASAPGVRVIHVVASKAKLRDGSYRDHPTLFYNVVAYAALQRILWSANYWPGGSRGVEVRFGHVRNHDHTDTHRYFQIRQRIDAPRTPFHLMTHLGWVSADQFEMSQAADIYAGFLKSAFWPSQWGDVDGSHLVRTWHQIRNSEACVISLGLQAKPDSDWAKSMPWWPCPNCASRY